MDDLISFGIEEELRVAREKRSCYNSSRKEIREQERDLDGFKLLRSDDQISNETSTLNENEPMEVEETTCQHQHSSSGSATSSRFSKFIYAESSSSDEDDDDDDNDFEVIDAYESFQNSDQSDSSFDDEEEENDFDKTLDERLHTYTNLTNYIRCMHTTNAPFKTFSNK